MKKRRGRIEKGKLFNHQLFVKGCHYRHQHMDDDDVLYCSRDVAKKASPVSI
jgi:hypothetical protein